MESTLNLSMLRKMQAINAHEKALIGTNNSSHSNKRFTKAETAWLQANSTKYTAAEAGIHLDHKPNTVRAKARHLGVQLKSVKEVS